MGARVREWLDAAIEKLKQLVAPAPTPVPVPAIARPRR